MHRESIVYQHEHMNIELSKYTEHCFYILNPPEYTYTYVQSEKVSIET